MERFILIILILLLVGAYWWHTLVYWNDSHSDVFVGKVLAGLALTGVALIFLFYLGYILNA